MRRFLKAALLVPMAALVTSAAPAPPPRTPTLGPTPTLITKPVWAREPTAVEFSCGFPAQYERAGGRRGAAVVR